MNDLKKIEAAKAFAEKKHEGQYRKGGDKYITHPLAVAEMLMNEGYGTDYIISGLFHDLLEDTDATEDEIKSLGGENVLKAVKLLTKPKNCYIGDYVKAVLSDPISKAVKGADRLHNLRCAVVCEEKFKIKYIVESTKWYLDFHRDIPKAVMELAGTFDKPFSTIVNVEEYEREQTVDSFNVKGDICYSVSPQELKAMKNGCVIKLWKIQ